MNNLANYAMQNVPQDNFDRKIELAISRVRLGENGCRRMVIETVYVSNSLCEPELRSIMTSFFDGDSDKRSTLYNLEKLRDMNGNNGHNGNKTKDDDDASKPWVYVR